MQGLFRDPHRLVTETIQNTVRAIEANASTGRTKIVLMNTSGFLNQDAQEKRFRGERFILFLLRYLLPPHADNEQAAEFLRVHVGQQHSRIDWVVVRPDTLTDDRDISDYQLTVSPVRSPIFNSGKASRINVGHFMAQLVTEESLWNQWRGKMPVLYNAESL
jgi:hypothetical protein